MNASSITLARPDVESLPAVVSALSEWQHDGAPIQLHPGDLGWAWQAGAQTLADNVRTWARGDRILAVGMLDGPDLARLAIAPEADHDQDLADQMLADLSQPARGILPEGTVFVEARFGEALRSSLVEQGWDADDPWTPLIRDLTDPVEKCGLRVEVVGPALIQDRVDVQNASFETSNFTPERWHTTAESVPYTNARCLVAYDGDNNAVSAVTVWSAGAGKLGVFEPMGVHRDHRGHGYGKAMNVAAAAELREMGASAATVCTPSSNVGAVATYVSAGFQRFPEVTDFRRDA